MVFQKPNPFPKSIYDNIAYGPRVNGRKGNMDDIVERGTDRRRTVGRGQGQAEAECARTLRWSAAAPVHRSMHRRAARCHPDGRAVRIALDPIATSKIEDLMQTLANDYTIIIVTHNMQQAARVSDRTAFFTAEVDDDGVRHGRWSRWTGRRTSSPIRLTPAPRPTSPGASADPTGWAAWDRTQNPRIGRRPVDDPGEFRVIRYRGSGARLAVG